VPDRDELAPIFLRIAPRAQPASRTRDLESALRARWDAARAAWPEVTVESRAFLHFLAERSGERMPALERAGDLYIACACALGAPAAIDAFRRRYRTVIAKAIRRIDPSDAFLDDVMQALGMKLFVASADGPPRIAQYDGRSSVRAWLATAATQTALNLCRRKDDQPHESVGSGGLALREVADPELLLMKARYKTAFESAIRAPRGSLQGADPNWRPRARYRIVGLPSR
jgi:RNA polymerase sigma-70 factor (ECF subfamily)